MNAAMTTTKERYMTTRALKRAVLAAVLALAAPCLAAAPAGAAFEIEEFTATATADTRAGGHPDVTTAFSFTTVPAPDEGYVLPSGFAREVQVELPPGLVGDPSATPFCPLDKFGAGSLLTECPGETQVGMAVLDIGLSPGELGREQYEIPVFNVPPEAGDPASFGFAILAPRVVIHTSIRTGGDYGLTATITGLNRAARLYGTTLTLWGVPASPAHDRDRGVCADQNEPVDRECPSTAPQRPFMRAPTSCPSGPLVSRLRVSTWGEPAQVATAEATTPAPTGCETVPFDASIGVTPDTTRTDSPTGLTVDVNVPQNSDPDDQAAGDLRKAVVTLPEGLTLSPGVADGLRTCTPAQFAEHAKEPAACPDGATLGSVEITSPLVPNPLTGPVWLGPADARAGSYPLYIDAATAGVRLKLVGDVAVDQRTGRLTATFADNPELPFSRFRLRFDGGPRAALATPAACADATGSTTADLIPWGAPLTPSVLGATSKVTWEGCGAQPFAPQFVAGTTTAAAGKGTGFTMQLRRDDRTAALGQIASVRLPQGLMANIGSVPLCGAGAAAAGACPAASRVGSVTVGAGAGSAPLHLGGDAYLTEGYGGAPFGLALTVRAVAGPLDFGTIVVRSAIRVGADSRITVETDPLPQMLGGIPLRLRSIALTLDRDGFMLNPTSCDPMEVGATLKSAGGTSVEQASRFQVAGCAALPLAPTMSATATRGGKGKPAGLTVHVGQKAGQANLRSVQVDVPRQLAVRLAALGTLCSAAQAAADQCPAAAQVGTATASTPVLAAPLRGPVFLVDAGQPLPRLVAQLRGSGITLPLMGDVALLDGRLRTTFASIPDVPIASFDLSLPATGNAVLQTAAALPCSGLRLDAVAVGQNNARRTSKVPVKVACTAAQKRAEAAARRPAVTSRRLSGSTLVLGVRVRGAGRVTVTGSRLRRATKKVTKAGTVTVRVQLSKAGQRKLRASRRYTGAVRVGYVPTSGPSASTTVQVKLKAATRRR